MSSQSVDTEVSIQPTNRFVRMSPHGIQGVVSKASPRSVTETVARLRSLLEGRGMTLFALIDHAANARAVGLEMQEAQVLVFGDPTKGTPVMTASPLVALELPMRALVWADDHGATWLSYSSPGFLAERYEVPDELTDRLAGIESLVDAALAT